MKAFRVQDEWGEGHACIVFHTSNAAARRIGCGEMDEEWENVSCTRAPQFDQYTPGPVPIEAMLAEGFWYECGAPGCSVRVIGTEPEDSPYFTDPARPDKVFCCPEHAVPQPEPQP